MLPSDPFQLAEQISAILFEQMLRTFPKRADLGAGNIAPLIGLTKTEKTGDERRVYGNFSGPDEIEPLPGKFGDLSSYLRSLMRWLEEDGLISGEGTNATLTRKGLEYCNKAFLTL